MYRVYFRLDSTSPYGPTQWFIMASFVYKDDAHNFAATKAENNPTVRYKIMKGKRNIKVYNNG